MFGTNVIHEINLVFFAYLLVHFTSLLFLMFLIFYVF